MLDLHTIQKYVWGLVGVVLAVVLLLFLCSGPSKAPKFVDKAEELCKTIDKKIIFQNDQKGVVICE